MKTAIYMLLPLLLLNTKIATAKTTAKADANPITVEGAYIYKPLQGSRATAGYGTFKNTGKDDITIAIVSLDGFKAVELHETVSEDGMMKMKKVDSFVVKKGGSFELKPGGNHIMLFDANKEFKEGETLNVVFKNGDKQFSLPFELKARDKKPEQKNPHAHH
ncbi:copper chaperone PCu(A)C [Pseudobdellovibrio exovorus]|uniref:Copper chaperone PCu(A)C n=1 Tax=Pseudobdellovibrio exovorus JSS TaxID=1184267 RepID=M4V8Z7_9BACT|nr:copper chaperone PCu(A)C [Pseudobdellovibrio exovorus]AGH94471.1 hypothetical protein A11Q_251 [Pseudobdellovibrio exovorus JSS]